MIKACESLEKFWSLKKLLSKPQMIWYMEHTDGKDLRVGT